jgi:proteasome lid subunit RPN8/RPN11
MKGNLAKVKNKTNEMPNGEDLTYINMPNGEPSIEEPASQNMAETVAVSIDEGAVSDKIPEVIESAIISAKIIAEPAAEAFEDANNVSSEDIVPDSAAISRETGENYVIDHIPPLISEPVFVNDQIEAANNEAEPIISTEMPLPGVGNFSEAIEHVAEPTNTKTAHKSISVDVKTDLYSAEAVHATIQDTAIVTEESSTETTPAYTSVTISQSVPEEVKVSKKGRKPHVNSQAASIKSPSKSIIESPAKQSTKSPPSKSPVKVAVTKRSYTRKIKPVKPVDVGEEISILSSSESAGSSKESINIMSSSNSDESITSLPSVASFASDRSTRSVNSGKSEVSVKSAKSVKSSKSNKSEGSTVTVKSAKSFKNNDSISDKSIDNGSSDSISSVVSETEVPDWEKAACPAFFKKAGLKNPEKRYKMVKKRIENILKKSPEILFEELVRQKLYKCSTNAIEQVYKILKDGDKKEEVVAIITEKKKATKTGKSVKKQQEAEINESTKKSESEDFELLKKMSSTSSGRKRKIRSEEGDWIDPNEIEGRVISHEPVQTIKEKRKKRIVKKSIEDEDLNSTEDPFRLILLHDFDDQSRIYVPGQVDENGNEFELVKAPFKVEICDSVILLMDLHSHLHSSEIIGLLGGVFIKEDVGTNCLPVLRINYVFPCSTAHSTGTQVDVDPLSEMEAGEYFESNGVRMTGWYHSHPNFEPNPSLRDLETQTMYQALFKNGEPDNNLEPFVGVIINPYMSATLSSSHVECFYVVPTIDPTQERLPYRLPIERIAFDSEKFPQILEKMREIIFKAESSNDRLDMRKNAQPGVKRIEKLFTSLQTHGNLTEDQMEQIKILFI